jgi:polar amino acid transport system substrate-binding protein
MMKWRALGQGVAAIFTKGWGWFTSKQVRKAGWLGLLGYILASALFLGDLTVAPTIAASDPHKLPTVPLQVATRIIPPFVMQEHDKLTGFSVELWQKIAAELKQESQFTLYPTLQAMLEAVQKKKADLAIAAISITAERDQKFDFSYPMFSSGLQVMVRNPGRTGFVPNLLRDLFSPVLMQLLGFALLMVVITAHIIWIFERHHPETIISKHYFPGIFEAAWWSASTLATQADQMPRGFLGRVIAVFWMFTAVVFVAYFTATVTTGMTVQKLQGDIKGVDDLAGHVVATTVGSTAAEFLHEHNIETLATTTIEEAYTALLNQQADALVFDAPVLMYYAAHEGKGKVMLAGDVFQEETYGILLSSNSPYRKAVNVALLKLRENGSYQALYQQWFKAKSEQ